MIPTYLRLQEVTAMVGIGKDEEFDFGECFFGREFLQLDVVIGLQLVQIRQTLCWQRGDVVLTNIAETQT